MNEIVQKAKAIIFANEGSYSSVNGNDNGAVSIGICQWHGNRAKDILKKIVKSRHVNCENYIDKKLYNEILSKCSWENRTFDTVKERYEIGQLLYTEIGKYVQDTQASTDIQDYIDHIMVMGFTDEETIIFLADIENQGGRGASRRIGENAFKFYGKSVTLENVVEVALADSVFCKYTKRRLNVYKKLVKRDYEDYIKECVSKITPTYYVVKSRDTITAIAKKYGTTVERIVKDNNIADKNIIIVGQKLRITKDGVK